MTGNIRFVTFDSHFENRHCIEIEAKIAICEVSNIEDF